MKLILLFVLFACGKHEQPSAIDIRDSDGDQVQNYLEGNLERYLADIDDIGEIKGVLKYSDSVARETTFTNRGQLKNEILSLMAGDNNKAELGEYFSEWSMLKIQLPPSGVMVTSSINTIHLEFSGDSITDELLLVSDRGRISLGKWQRYMRIELNQNDFIDLMKGKAALYVKKYFKSSDLFTDNTDSTIRNKTYRVFFYDGERSKVLYVSKDFPFEELLESLNISETTKLDDAEIFFNSNRPGSRRWYTRDINENDKALSYSLISDIRVKLLEKFESKTLDLRRENGVPVNNLQLNNKKNAKIYLKVRPSRFMRTFTEHSIRRKHETGNDYHGTYRSWHCTYLNRSVTSETFILPSWEDFLMKLKLDPKNLLLMEQRDEKGVFWEIIISNSSANLNMILPPRSAETFTTTGQYGVNCTGFQAKPIESKPGYQTNSEGKLSYFIESYVEKIP